MMEGIGSEAASLAAHWKLDNLCWIYDSNNVTLDGPAGWAFSEDVGARFLAYGWNVLHVRDANDLKQVAAAYQGFLEEKSRPTMIIVESHIGYGSPNKQDSNKSHGSPLGVEEVRLTKKFYGWPEDSSPSSSPMASTSDSPRRWASAAVNSSPSGPTFSRPTRRSTRTRARPSTPSSPGKRRRPPSTPYRPSRPTRRAWRRANPPPRPRTPWRLTTPGSSAARRISTSRPRPTRPRRRPARSRRRAAAAATSISACASTRWGRSATAWRWPGLRPYGATFLIFSDYMRPAIRLSSLQELPSIWVFTHDSIGVGEDGPTHQPVEQIPSLRAIPGLFVLRPGDANEAAEAWKFVIGLKHSPAALILSRQAMPTLDRTVFKPAAGVQKGAYVLADPKDGEDAEVILMGTGSELYLCVQAYEALVEGGHPGPRRVHALLGAVRTAGSRPIKDEVLPPHLVSARVAVEQAAHDGMGEVYGPARNGAVVGMHTFGASAPLPVVADQVRLHAREGRRARQAADQRNSDAAGSEGRRRVIRRAPGDEPGALLPFRDPPRRIQETCHEPDERPRSLRPVPLARRPP